MVLVRVIQEQCVTFIHVVTSVPNAMKLYPLLRRASCATTAKEKWASEKSWKRSSKILRKRSCFDFWAWFKKKILKHKKNNSEIFHHKFLFLSFLLEID